MSSKDDIKDIKDIKDNCVVSITELIEKYKDDEYMLQRLHTRVVNYLQNDLDYEYKKREKNVNRTNYLTNEKEMFIQIFLSKNKYYYLPNNNCFYEYNGKNYSIIKEDDIIHKLLSTISKDRTLMEWKHKTKKNAISIIKERSLLSSTPESETIQNVLNILYPSIFISKNQAKYFLTIIGDNIFKKNSEYIFLVSQKTKKILIEIDNISYLSIGYSNITHNFMTKYHENHSYENCRLLKINESFSIELWKDIIKKIGLDLLCISAHYSTRYENSDNYLNTKADEELKNYALYLKNNTINDVVSSFCSSYFTSVIHTNNTNNSINNDNNENFKIEWKNVHYIWKQFISNMFLPNIIYSNTLKTILKEKYSYDESSDSFINITSKYLPTESDFIKFWNNSITSLNEAISIEDTFDNEFEIDELCTLFKYWSKQNKINETILSNGNISDENVLKILKHFFPNIEIIKDKYVLNITSNLWNKVDDIKKSINFIYNENKLPLISFDDAYNNYCIFCNTNSYKFIVSKHYFEKYFKFYYANHIVYEKFIETSSFADV
jgi:hypothetical protein